jgi:hypothetical protein
LAARASLERSNSGTKGFGSRPRIRKGIGSS